MKIKSISGVIAYIGLLFAGVHEILIFGILPLLFLLQLVIPEIELNAVPLLFLFIFTFVSWSFKEGLREIYIKEGKK